MLQKFYISFFLLIFIAGFSSCSLKTPQNNNNTQVSAEKKLTPEEEEFQKKEKEILEMARKMNPYIACINKNSAEAIRSYNKYISWVDEKNGPQLNAQKIDGILQMSDPNQCVTLLEEAKKNLPKTVELEQSGDTYVASLKKLHPVVNEAFLYYSEKQYEKDGMKKGKEMHAKLLEAFSEFRTSDENMRSMLDKLEDDQTKRELELLEKKEGRSINFLLKNVLAQAKIFVNAATNEDFTKIDPDTVTSAQQTYEKAFQELKDFNNTSKNPKVEYFIKENESFLNAGKELTKRVQEKRNYTQEEKKKFGTPNEFKIEGSPMKFIQAYNTMVDQYNIQSRLGY